jgi:arylformamidase
MKINKIYDVSLPIHPGMLTFPGNPEFNLYSVKSIVNGGTSNVSQLHIGTHAGTHVDAPRHFIEGKPGIDAVNPTVLIGPARLFQLPRVKYINRQVLEKLDLKGVSRLLLGTRNSRLLKKGFTADYAFVSEDAAHYIVETGIKLVGIDWLTIDEYQKVRPSRTSYPAWSGHGDYRGTGLIRRAVGRLRASLFTHQNQRRGRRSSASNSERVIDG